MGQLSVVKSAYDKRDVSTIIQKLLAHQTDRGTTDLDPAGLATMLVDLVWDRRKTPTPEATEYELHGIVLAAMALAFGFQSLPEPDPKRPILTIALANVLAEIEANTSFPLTEHDRHQIAKISGIFAEMLAEYNRNAAN